MTRDEIYDHLAQVYLGKRKKTDEKKTKHFNAWLIINIIITGIIFASVSYGLTAFLSQKKILLRNNVVFNINKGPVRLEYNFTDSVSPEKSFSMSVPQINIDRYNGISFFIRAKEEGSPGIIKVVVKNDRNEISSYYVKGIDLKWKEVKIPLSEFKHFSDWGSLNDISFVLESWNAQKAKGIVLIEDISFYCDNSQLNPDAEL